MGFPYQVCDLMDAIRILDELPSSMRDEAFHATYAACREGLKGVIAANEARDVFCAFARRRGMLIEELWMDTLREGGNIRSASAGKSTT